LIRLFIQEYPTLIMLHAVILAKKVIVDEDSPFTETIFAVVPESGDAFENELQEDSYTFINIQSGIYLHNRTLLI